MSGSLFLKVVGLPFPKCGGTMEEKKKRKEKGLWDLYIYKIVFIVGKAEKG